MDRWDEVCGYCGERLPIFEESPYCSDKCAEQAHLDHDIDDDWEDDDVWDD